MENLFQNQYQDSQSKVGDLIELLARHISLHECMNRAIVLAEYVRRPLTVLVAGPFNCGKSTLLNCLLGQNILPSDVVPTTAIATRLSYGTSEKVSVRHSNGKNSELSFAEFREVVTEESHLGVSRREDIVELNLMLPVELLRHVTLIDSPGLHSLSLDHTQRTDNTHAEVDAVLWVTSCAQSASAAEVEDIKRLTGRLKPLIIANQVDLLDDEEDRGRVLEQMRIRLGSGSAGFFGLSSKAALQGIILKDKTLIQHSGWSAFFDFLASGFIPNCFAQRFSLVASELLSLLQFSQEALEDELATLEELEQEFQNVESELFEKQLIFNQIEEGLAVVRELHYKIPEVHLSTNEDPGWLVEPTERCKGSLALLALPTDHQFMTLKELERSKMTMEEIHPEIIRFTALLSDFSIKADKVEGFQKSLTRRETALQKRQQSYSRKNSVVRSLSFLEKKKLDEDVHALRVERDEFEEQLKSVKMESRELFRRINGLAIRYFNVIGQTLSILQRSQVEAKQSVNEAASRLEELRVELELQVWARQSFGEFENAIVPTLLKSFVSDVANARWFFRL